MLMALNMGPSCTYDEALRNLYKHTATVFEVILKGESKTVISRVKKVRNLVYYPRIRAKHQLQDGRYAEVLEEAFSRKAPELAEHMRKRSIFVDYMLETGIFTNETLDRQHQEVRDELGVRYLLRMQEYERWAVIGDSRTLVGSEDLEAEEHSQLADDGHDE